MTRGRAAALALLLFGAVACAVLGGGGGRAIAAACTKSWSSAVDGAWTDGTKWTDGTAPTSGDDVCIAVSGTYTVTMNGGQSVHALTVGGTAVSGTQTLVVQGTNSINTQLSLGADGDVTTHGSIVITSTGGGYSYLELNGHTLANAGSVSVTAGSGGARYLRGGPFVNTGAFATTDGLESNNLSFTNQGTVTVAGGDWSLNTSFTNTSGSVTSSGTGQVVSNGTYTQGNGTASGNPILVAGGNLTYTGGGASSVVARGGITLTGNLVSGQSLTVQGTNSINTTVNLGGDVANAGSITQTSTGGGYSYVELNGHTLASSGSYAVTAGSGGARYLRGGPLVNTGAFATSDGLESNNLSFTNQGAVTVAGGDWSLNTSFANVSGSVASSGAGQVVSNGTYTQGSGTASGNPILVAGGNLTYTGGGASSVVARGGITLTGNLVSGQSLTVQGTNSINTTVTLGGDVANAGSITQTSTGGGWSYVELNGHTLANSGSFSVTSGTGGARYLRGGPLVNTGVFTTSIALESNNLSFTNQGTVSVTAGDWTLNTSFTNTSGSVTATGTGEVVSANHYTQGNGTTAGNPILVTGGTLTYGGGGASAVVARGGITLGGNIVAGQSLEVQGTSAVNTTVTLGSDVANAGSITQTSTGGGYSYVELNGHTLTNSGSLSVLPGSGGARYLRGGPFVNTGVFATSIALESNNLSFTNQGTVTLTAGDWTLNTSFTNASGSVTTSGTADLVSQGTYTQGNGTTSGNPVLVTGGTVHYTGTGASTVAARGGVTLSGDIAAGQSFIVQGTSSTNTTVTLGSDLTNAGSMELTSTGGGYGYLELNGHAMTNDGLFSVTAGGGGSRFLRGGPFLNHGTISLGAGETLSSASLSFVQSASGQLRSTIDGGGAFGRWTGMGAVTLGGIIGVDGGATQPTGTTYPVLGYTSATGTFATRDFGGQGYAVQYNANNLTLVALVPGNSDATILSSSSSVLNGQAVTFTVTVVAVSPATGTPTGNVVFSDGLTPIATVALDGAGHAAHTTSTLTSGSHSISARYQGDDNFSPDDTPSTPVTVASGGNVATVGVVGNPASIVEGQTATFTTTVSGGVGTPTGTVEFLDGATLLGSATLDGSGHTSLDVSSLTAATHNITAHYLGDATYGSAMSPVLSYTVDPVNVPTVAVVGNPSSIIVGQTVTFTATVSGGVGTPTGTVEFLDGATPLGSATLDGAGNAALGVSSLTAATHNITGHYLGDVAYAAASSPVLSYTVDPGSSVPTVGVIGTPSSIIVGQTVTFTATVSGGVGTPTGTVEFLDGASVLGSAALDGSGNAALGVSSLTAATHDVTAHYLGDATYAGGTSPVLSYTVDPPIVTDATFSVNANPVFTGGSLTITATVSSAGGTPTGAVEFRDATSVLGTQPLDGAGQASWTASGLVVGAHSISVAYTGAATFATSASPVLVVSAEDLPGLPGPGATAIVLSGPLAPLSPGDQATFTATVLHSDPTAPTGAVDFLDGTTTLGSIALDGAGHATFTTAPLDAPTGEVTVQSVDLAIVASYPGDASYTGSSTDPFPLTVGGTGPPPPQPPPPPPPPPTDPTTPTTPTTPTDTPTTPDGTTDDGTTLALPAAGATTGATATTPTTAPTSTTTPGSTVAGRDADRRDRSSDDGSREEASQSGPTDGGSGGDSGFFAPLERSALVESIAAPGDVDFSAKQLAANFSLALLFILLSWFPAELINSVLKEHHHRFGGKSKVRAWLDRLEARVHSLPLPVLFVGFTVLGALIYGLLDPHFGFNQTTVLMLSAIFVGLVMISFAHEYVRAWYVKRFLNVPAHFETFPIGIALAVILVFFSRLAHFQPGYVFGIVAGVAFRGDVETKEEGKSLAVASLATLVLALVTWLAWIPVRDAAILPHPGAVAIWFDALFAFVWIFAIQTVVFSLIPLRFLDGERVIKWSRVCWLLLYLAGMFVFVTTLVHPTSEQYGGSSQATFWSMLILFVTFTVVAILIWAWFRFEDHRKRRFNRAGSDAGEPEREELPSS